jgi:hypothetical protein
MRLTPLLILICVSAFCQDNQQLRFVENKGQWNKEIDFHALVPGGRLGVSANGFSVVLLDMEEIEGRHLDSHAPANESNALPTTDPINGHYFKINLLGSNPASKAIVDSPLDGYHNYYQGNDVSRWATNARAFATILYKDVYDGIDFRVSSLGKNLKYDFIVKPGADPSLIRIEYSGVDGIAKLNDELAIATTVGSLTEMKPFTYQVDNNKKRTVPSEYRLQQNVVSFSFPSDYDASRELIIDPLLIFSTYSGSTADNWGSTATPGEHGTLYSAGVTRQEIGGFFPATVGAFQTYNRGAFDMAIIKYDSLGTRFLYATLLGGFNNDSPESLVVDKTSGDLIVLGITSSPDYPTGITSFDRTFNQGIDIFNRVLNTEDQWDIVVTRLSPDGHQLVGSTFLGGSDNDGLNRPKQLGGSLVANYGDEMRGDVITDDAGNVYVSSVTSSANFPIVNGFDNSFNGGNTDGLVVKMSPDLSSITWSTYLGGAGLDAAYSIKFDNDKNLVVAGGTTSTNFPTTSGSYQTTFKGIVDGWVARVAADGSAILNATLTGTNSFDQVYFVDLNSSGEVFVYGQTAGHMPVTSGVYRNLNTGQFLQKFSSDLTTLQMSTIFGAASPSGLVIPNISPTAFLVNDCDNIYMAGWGGFVNSSLETGFWQSSTNGMPITADAYQKTTSGSDFYFMVLNGDATKLVYSTYLGGNSSKTHVDGGTSRFDKYGIVYHAVCSGCAFGNTMGQGTSDFPTTPNAKSRLNRSVNCNNAAFKFDLSSLRAIFDTNNLALTMPGFNNVCYPDTVVFQNLSTGGKSIEWDFGDGTIVTQTDTDQRWLFHRYQEAGEYRVKLKITDLSTCSQTDSTFKIINYLKPEITVGEDTVVCEGSFLQLMASGGVTYEWTSSDGTFSSSQQSPVILPKHAVAYYVTVVDHYECALTDTLNVAVTPNVHAAFQTYDLNFSRPGYNNVCHPGALLFKNLSVQGIDFIWDFDDGTVVGRTNEDTTSITHAYQQQGVYHVQLKAINPNTCNKADSVMKTIHYFKDQIQVGEDGEICEGSSFELKATGGSIYTWFTNDNPLISSSPSAVVQPTTTTEYFVTVTDANKCSRKDTIQVSVLNSVDLKWEHLLKANCNERPSVLVLNTTPPVEGVKYHFDFGDGTTSEETRIEHVYEEDNTYALELIATKKFCIFKETVQLPVYQLMVPNVFTPDGSKGLNDNFEIVFGEQLIDPSDVGVKVAVTVTNRWGRKVFESSDYQNDWSADELEGGVYYVHLKIGDFTTCKNWVHIVK